MCALAVHEHPLLDLNLRGYACDNGHVFYTTLVEQIGGIPIADTVIPPPMSDDIQIMKFWLTDKEARKRLPNELAVVCRRLVEIAENKHHIARVANPFAFCPTCGAPLSNFDSDDGYMQGLRCSTGHEFWWRGYRVHYVERGVRTQLSVDLDDDWLKKLIEFYAGDDKLIGPYVHPQLRGVMNRYSKRA